MYTVLVCLGILVAMLLSDMPKKAAVAFIAFLQIFLGVIDHLMAGSSWLPFYIHSISESIGAVLLIFCSRWVDNFRDRAYFYLMSAFLWVSAAIVPLFRYDVIVYHSDYIFYSQTVACLHLLAMLIFADGTRNFARSIHDSLSVGRGWIRG